MIYEFVNCRVDTESRELRRSGELINIQPKAFDLLVYLMDNRSRAVGKEELLDEIWGTLVTESALTRCAMKLRKAIGDEDGSIVKTVQRHGYRFVGRLVEDQPEAPPISDEKPADPEHKMGIAVLPMANMSGDPENEYFSDGVAEEILNLLAKIPAFRVASRTSAFSYRNTSEDLKTIASNLSVDFVLEGSVRRAGNRVRITAQLIDAAQDAHLWSEIYDRELTDIFELQAEIADKIVTAVTTDGNIAIPRYKATDQPQAYDYYLRGLTFLHRIDRGGWDFAQQMFSKAIEVDPAYAKAWAGIAMCASWRFMWSSAAQADLREAEETSEKALKLDPNLAEAWCAKGFSLTLSKRFDDAANAFEKAIGIDPMSYEAWYLYGRSRFAEGKPLEADRLFAKAAQVRPDEYQAAILRTTALESAGRAEEAKSISREGIARAERALSFDPEDTRAMTLAAGAYVNLGEIDKACELLERALKVDPEDISVLHNCGCTFAAAGHIDRALDVFEERFRLGTAYKEWIDNDPDFDVLRDLPRFKAMVRTN